MKNPFKKDGQFVAEYQEVFATEQGKRVLEDILRSCHITTSSFNSKTPDPYLMAFREGERNVGLKIMAVLGMDAMKVKQMIEEGEKQYAG